MDKIALRIMRRTKLVGDCKVWQGKLCRNGYGKVKYKGSRIAAHRALYQSYHNITLDTSQFVCHTCDNRACCNLDHLFVGSHIDNMEDMKRKGRSTRGRKNRAAKLTEVQVVEIIKDSSSSLKTLSNKYNVSFSTISQIRNRRIWKHVKV